jgi:hypothetical protein
MEPYNATIEKKRWVAARENFESLCLRLESNEALCLTHSGVESFMKVDGDEIMRLLFQDHLTLRGMMEEMPPTPVVGEDGVERTHMRRRGRALESIFGTVEVSRLAHGKPGVISLFPLDGDLNLPVERYSLGVRRRLAFEVAGNPFDMAIASVEMMTAASLPKRQAEELALRAAADFEAFYDARPETPDKPGALLVMSLDGKGVVMRVEDLKPATRKKAQKKKPKMTKRTSPGEKRNAKRMATVAAIYTVDLHVRTPEEVATPPKREERKPAPRPVGKRVWASLERSMAQVITEMFDEAFRQDPQGEKIWVCLTDGNPTQIRLVKERAAAIGVKLVIVLDIIHVLEYLWGCSSAFNQGSSPEAEAWVTERLLRILKGESSLVAAGIRRSATLRKLSKTARAAVDKCANYLLKLGDYLHYDQYLALGLPIASGVIEGACRHLIKDRMDVTGARWSLEGAEAVLKLRALKSSGDFDAYWTFHEAKELERNHTTHYANNLIPFKRPEGRKRLELDNCAS